MTTVNIGSVELSPLKAAWLRVVCRMNGESRRIRVGKILEGHLPRFLNIYVAELDFLSRQYGVSWEAMFVLLNDESRSLPFNESDLEWAAQQPPLVKRDELKANNLGIELKPQDFAQELSATVSLDAEIALNYGFRDSFSAKTPPTLDDHSPWAVGYRMGKTFQSEHQNQEKP